MSTLAGTGTNFPNGINVPASKIFIDGVAATPASAMSDVTASAAEINLIDGSVAGTAVASKALVLDANKQIDTIGLSTGAQIIGSQFEVSFPQVAAADVAKTFFIAPAACKVVSAQERHVTVAGQACTLQIEKLTTGTAPGAGVNTLSSAFDLTSTANTPVSKNGVGTANGNLTTGDALCLKVASGSATSYALGTITVLMQWI